MALAKGLEVDGRMEDGVAVLRALAVYLDSLPAFPDGSCRRMTENHLEKMSARMRQNAQAMKGNG